jgi:hypothetical protein
MIYRTAHVRVWGQSGHEIAICDLQTFGKSGHRTNERDLSRSVFCTHVPECEASIALAADKCASH